MIKSILRKIKKKIITILFGELNEKLINLHSKEINDLKILIAKQLIHNQKNIDSLNDAEFKVFSQWGDDGMIQYLINNIKINEKSFIEFGVENFKESNTRFLLINNNWTGLVMDGSQNNINFIKKDEIYWKYSLNAKRVFITAENVNEVIMSEGIEGQIGLLHIDIDGMDYWIWNALNIIEPQIVIIEYNSVFGNKRPITVPYQSDFVREKSHNSFLYFGASLPALCYLAEKKGYTFVGSNSNGNNAYFVKSEYINSKISEISVKEGYVESKFKESRNKKGDLSFLTGKDRKEVIRGLSVYNVINEEFETL